MKTSALLVVQTLLAVQKLVHLAREAQKDGELSSFDLITLLGEGVIPILALYGIKIDLGNPRTIAGREVEDASGVLNGLLELVNLQD